MAIDHRRYSSQLWTGIEDPKARRALQDLSEKLEALARAADDLDGLPSGFVGIWFDGRDTIPKGWTEVGEAKGRFFRHMPDGGTAGDIGGSATHTHTGDTSNNGSHQHSLAVSKIYASGTTTFATDASSTGSAGGHTHTLNVAAADNLPLFIDGILIRKD